MDNIYWGYKMDMDIELDGIPTDFDLDEENEKEESKKEIDININDDKSNEVFEDLNKDFNEKLKNEELESVDNKEIILGIDFGISYTVTSYIQNKTPKIIKDKKGNSFIPSVISTGLGGTILVGEKKPGIYDKTRPNSIVYSAKRFLGKQFSEIEHEVDFFPFEIKKDDDNNIKIRLDKEEHSPQEICSMILKKAVEFAETNTGSIVKKVVLTIPAYFDENQKNAIVEAAKIANLEVLHILNDPAAAALAYGIHNKTERYIAVYDFGGTSFSITILRAKDGIFKVVTALEDLNIGGDSFDRMLIDKITKEIQSKHFTKIVTDKDFHSLLLVKNAIEDMKIELTKNDEAKINIKYPDHGIDFIRIMQRREFESYIEEDVNKTIEICNKALEESGLSVYDIKEVILSGGSSQIPLVRQKVQEFFGQTPRMEINPDEVVAYGASVLSDLIASGDFDLVFSQKTEIPICIETSGGGTIRIIDKGISIPAQNTIVFTNNFDNQETIKINILIGERFLAKNCKKIGELYLDGFEAKPEASYQIHVTAMLDNEGVLSIFANEMETGLETSADFQPFKGIMRKDVEKIVADAEEYKEKDEYLKQLVEKQNDTSKLIERVEEYILINKEQINKKIYNDIVNGLYRLKNSILSNNLYQLKLDVDMFMIFLEPLNVKIYDKVINREMKFNRL